MSRSGNYNMTCASNEASDQRGYPPSLFRVFAVESERPKPSSGGQRKNLTGNAHAEVVSIKMKTSLCLVLALTFGM